tara:strand:+ start:530 stop:1696 length:1167 start_codon:yes stop_codon:yes gene_type:complete
MSFRDYQNIVESVGNRVNARKENLSQREFDIKDYLQQKGANQYRQAMQNAEDKYKLAEDIYTGDLSKYQDKLLKAIGLDEEQQEQANALINLGAVVGLPIASKLGKAGLKRLRGKDGKGGVKEKIRSAREPTDRIQPRDTRALQEEARGAQDEEFGGRDVNVPEPEPVAESTQPRPTPEPEGRGGGGDIEMTDRSSRPSARGSSETSPSEGMEMQDRSLQQDLQAQEDSRVAQEAEQVETRNAQAQADFDAQEATFEAETGGGAGVEEAGAGAEEAGAAAAEEEGATGAFEAAEEAGAAAGPEGWAFDALLAAGFGIFELGNAFHWWGGGGSQNADSVGPPPTPPKPPDLEDIPKPKNIQVGGPVMTSARYHQNTAPASVINSSMLRR